MTDRIHLGFEVGSGAPVSIPIHHLTVTGQTRLSGKTTTIEALLSRLPEAYCALLFSTKRGELAFASVPRVDPFYRQHTDWEYVESLLEAAMKERMRMQRSFIINACTGAHTLRQVYNNIIKGRKEARRGFDEAMFTNLQAYFEKVLPQLEAHPFADSLPLGHGPNVMDLGHLSEEVQALVIAACLEELHARGSKTVVVIPEAWKFIPQSRGNPVKWAAEHVVREGGASQLWLWFDAQDITGMDKQPLKSVGVWLLGRQMEVNEVKRVLAQVPSSKKPKPEDVARLPVGYFFTAAEDWCRAVYVQPAWLDPETARKVALGEVPAVGPPEIPQVPTLISEDKTGQFQNMPNCPEEEDPMVIAELREQLAKTEIQRDEARNQLGQVAGNLAKADDEAVWLRGQLAEKDKTIAKNQFGLEQLGAQMEEWGPHVRAAAKFREAIQEFLGPGSTPVGQPALDLDALAKKVSDRIGTGQLVIQVAPPEALRKKYLEQAAARLFLAVGKLSGDARQAIELLQGQDRFFTLNRVALALSGSDSGGTRQRWSNSLKELKELGMVSQGGSGRAGWRANLRGCVEQELAPHGAMPEEVEMVVRQVLYSLATKEGLEVRT